MDDCLFCKMVAGDIPVDKVHEDDDVLAFRDINPQGPVHLLVIPKRHISSLNEVEPGDIWLIGKMQALSAVLAQDEGIAESGYRTVINCNPDGGQDVYHIHLHLIGGRRMGWPPG